jgi:membrane protein CcdC involved in cytochrome C biogenesis
MTMMITTTIFGVFMAVIILIVRLRASRKPANTKRILLPPFFMATGFFMFVFPAFRVEPIFAIYAFLIGNFFSIFLIKSSTFIEEDKKIYLKRSKLFIVILLSLVIIRLALKTYVNQYVSLYETSSLFFILAFGMILPWRIAMFINYQKLAKLTSI